MMNLFVLEREKLLHVHVDDAWEFFSNPLNLKLITPPELGLVITSGNNGEIYPGMIITYELNIISFFKSVWATEITHVNKPRFFVDEQKVGPYSFWHHKHFFKQVDSGTVVKDIVHYSLPFGPLGKLLNRYYIKQNLDDIFDYRETVLDRIFSSTI